MQLEPCRRSELISNMFISAKTSQNPIRCGLASIHYTTSKINFRGIVVKKITNVYEMKYFEKKILKGFADDGLNIRRKRRTRFIILIFV